MADPTEDQISAITASTPSTRKERNRRKKERAKQRKSEALAKEADEDELLEKFMAANLAEIGEPSKISSNQPLPSVPSLSTAVHRSRSPDTSSVNHQLLLLEQSTDIHPLQPSILTQPPLSSQSVTANHPSLSSEPSPTGIGQPLPFQASTSTQIPHSSEPSTQPPPSIKPSTGIYQRLPSEKSIRLLRILPGRAGTKVQTTIEVVDLEDPACPEYVALSYCWGNPNPPAEILCNGKPLSVTPNLESALQQLRRPLRPVRPSEANGDAMLDRTIEYLPIWIDVICINQTDIEERSQQVSFMKDIYSKARSVIIWLGEDIDGDAYSAICLLRKLANLARKIAGKHDTTFEEILSPDIRRVEVMLRDAAELIKDLPPQTDPDWDKFNNLCGREWFERLWIIQEVAFSQAARVVIGACNISWSDLSVGALMPMILPFLVSGPGVQRSIGLDRLWCLRAISDARRPRAMVVTLSDTYDFQASDLRDRIFALLGLPDTGPALRIVPDYSKPAVDIYADVCRQLMSMPFDPRVRQGTLDILGPRGIPPGLCEADRASFPSWVPLFGAPIRGYIDRPLANNTFVAIWHTGIHRSAHIKPTANSNHLTLGGVHLVNVEEVWEKWSFWSSDSCTEKRQSWPSQLPDPHTGFQTIFQTLQDKLPKSFGPHTFGEALAATITAGFPARVKAQQAGDRRTPYTEADMNQYINHGKSLSNFEGSITHFGDEQLFVTAELSPGFGRFLGMGRGGVRAGDKICCLWGGRVLYVLRPVEVHHILVGECYVHGLMHGEIHELRREGRITIENEYIEIH